MARDDVLLNPGTSLWSVTPELGTALAGSPVPGTGHPGSEAATADATAEGTTDDGTTDDAVLVAVVGDPAGPGDAGARTALAALGLDADAVLVTHEPRSRAGWLTTVPLPPGEHAVRRVVLVGVADGSDAAWRTAAAAVGRATRGRFRVVHAIGENATPEALTAYVEAAVLASWGSPRWTRHGPTVVTHPASEAVVTGTSDAAAVARAVARARAQLLARGLAMTPSNTKNPAWLARQARTVARRAGLDVQVWDERRLHREGFGGILAVGRGSATPPRLVRLDHEPVGATESTPRVVLVGKGITFDTGGLQVKPVDGMVGMKSDMSGAAIVLAVLAACRDLEVGVRVTGLLALAENAVDGASYHPGDVVTQYGGRTVEIGNTDAEGRIVLADALAYADAHLDPAFLVDVATLTGAARIALGRAIAPVFATDTALADTLVAAGATTGETLWPMPLADTYRRALDSDVAEIAHIAPGVGGGAVTAALFLREFAGERRWAHLDIAGTGRSDVDAGISAKGATGFGTRLLLRWLEEMA